MASPFEEEGDNVVPFNPVEFERMEQRRASLAAVSSFEDDPDEAARAQDLSKATGAHPSMVYADLDGFEARHKAALTSSIIDDNKFMQQWINDHPLASKVSNDDIGQLDVVTQKLHRSGLIGAPSSIANEAIQGAVRGWKRDEALGTWALRAPGGKEAYESGLAGQLGVSIAAGLGIPLELLGKATTAGLEGIKAGVKEGYTRFGGSEQGAEQLSRDVAGMAEMMIMGGGPHAPHVTPDVIDKLQAHKLMEYIKAGKEPPPGISVGYDLLKAEESTRDIKNYDELMKESQASNTKERSPELFANYIRNHTDAQMAISAKKVAELYGDKLPAPDDGLLGWIPNLAERLPLEREANGYIEVPLADWVARIDPEVEKQLHDDLRVRRYGLSKNEIDETKEIGKFKDKPFPEGPMPQLDVDHEPTNAVRSTLNAEPMFDLERARKLKLARAEAAYDIVGLHEFDLVDNAGASIGRLKLQEFREGEHLNIEWVGGGRGAGPGVPNAFGPGVVRDLLVQLRREFPEAKTIGGRRVTGAREAAGVPIDKQGVKINLRNPDPENLNTLAFHLNVISSPVSMVPLTADFTPQAFGEGIRTGPYVAIATYKARDAVEMIRPEHVATSSVTKALLNFFGDRVKDFAGDVVVRVVSNEDFDAQRPTSGGFYNAPSHTIVLPAKSADGTFGRLWGPEVLLHELGHAVTYRAMWAEPKLRAKFEALRQVADLYISENLPEQRKMLDYGLKDRGNNPGEFIAEAWGNQDFQNTLSHVPLPKEIADLIGLKEGNTVWDAIRRVIADILEGIIGRRPEPTVLDGLLHVHKEIEALHELYPELREPGIRGFVKKAGFAEGAVIRPEAKAPTPEMMRDAGLTDYEINQMKREPDETKLRQISEGYAFDQGSWKKITPEIVGDWEEAAMHASAAKEVARKKLDEAFSKGDRPNVSSILGSDWQPHGLTGEAKQYKDAAYNFLESKFGYAQRQLSKYERVLANAQEAEAQAGRRTLREEPEAPEKPVSERPVIKTPGTFGLTAEQFRRYKQLINKRMAEDHAAEMSRAIKEEAKKQSQEWKANAVAMRPEVKQDIYARPDIAANEFFRTGTLFGQRGKTPRLDPRYLTPEQRANLPEGYTRRGGMNPDDIAGTFGYQSGSAMVDRIIMLNQTQKQVNLFGENFINMLTEKEVDRRMQEKYGDPAANALQEAKDRVMNETQLDIIHEDILALAEKAKAQMPFERAAVKQWVQEQFLKTPMRAVDSDGFISEAGKAGTRAELHLLRGDFGKAFAEKQAQYIATLKAQQAVKVEKTKGQFDRLAGTYEPRTGPGGKYPNTPQEYTNWIHDILMRIGYDVDRTPEDLAKSINNMPHKTFEKFVQSKEDMLRETGVADLVMDPQFKKKFDDLTVDEFQAIHQSVKGLAKTGKLEKKLIRQGNARDLDETMAEMYEQMRVFGSKHYDASGKRWLGPIPPAPARVLRTFVASHLQIESLVNRWDKGDPFGIFTTHITRELLDSASAEAIMEKNFSRKLRAIADNVDLSKKIDNDVFIDPFSIERGEPTPILMTRKNLRAVMQHLGNESNFNKLAKGYLHDPDMAPGDNAVTVFKQRIMDWVHKNATKEDWDWVSKQGKIFADLKEEADAMYRRLTDIEPESLPLRPVDTKFGQYEGWYHPLDNHPLWKGSSKSLAGSDPLEEGGYYRAMTGNRYTQKRTGAVYPLDLDLDMTPIRMKQMIHDINFREALIEASKVIYDKRFTNMIKDFYGREYAELFEPWLKDVAGSAGNKSAAQNVGLRALEHIRQNIIATLIGFNPGTVMKHGPTAAINSFTEVNPVTFLKNIKSLFSVRDEIGESNWKFAMDNFAELQRRTRHYSETMGGAQNVVLGELGPVEALKLGKLPSYIGLRESIIKLGSSPVALADLLSAVPTALGAFETAMKDPGMAVGDATYLANRAVRRAHGSTAVVSRPAIARQGGFVSYIASLYGFFSHIWNRQFELGWKMRETAGLVKEGEYAEAAKQLPGQAAMLFSYVLFPAIVEEMVTPMTNEERESWGKKSAKALAFGLTSSWIGIRDVVHAMLHLQDPQAGLVTTTLKTATDLARDLSKGPRAFDKAHMGMTIQHGITAVGAATGMMNATEGKVARFVHDYATGVQKPRGWNDWYHGIRYGTMKVRH